MKEPELIKAGDTRLKLGHPGQPPLVDVRVIAEENYQELLNQANKNLVKAHVSGQLFCDKAERFVAWLNDENLDSFWKGDKLLYYWTERDGEDIPAETVLARFEEEQKLNASKKDETKK